jgi:two-component system chemotaxis response regulator CheB
MPVIMCSSLTQRGAKVTIEALACGASDYVAKPTGQADRQMAAKALALELIPKIQALTGPQQQFQYVAPRSPLFVSLVPPPKAPPITSIPVALAIGVSTGGPAALDVMLPTLPGNFPLPVLIVQHMPELFTKLFAERLNGRCSLRVQEAAEGMPVSVGCIYIAKGNWHMEVIAALRAGLPNTLHLTQGPPENHCRPAADVLFRSVAAVYGAGALALVLTGMGSDGMLGCRVIRDHGGSVLAQDQATSTVWGMPGAVTNAGLAQKVLPLGAIAPEILRLVSRTHTEARELREMVV